MSMHFGPIRQLGYVVRDLRAAMEHWITFHGVGPFHVLDANPVRNLQYRGQPCPARLAFAFAHSGPLQIELIHPLDDTPSLYQEFLAEHGEGLQHVAYWTTPEGYDAFAAKAEALGMQCVQSGYTGDPEARFGYYLGGSYPGTCVEFSARSAAKQALSDAMARSAVGWNGKDPVRTVLAASAPVSSPLTRHSSS